MKKVLGGMTIALTIILLAGLLYAEMEDPGTEKAPAVKKKVICVKVEGEDPACCHLEGGSMGCCMMKGHGLMGCCSKGGEWGMMNYLNGAKFYLKFEEKIGLSESQVEKLKTIGDESEKAAIRLKAELKTLMVDFKSLLGEDKIDLSQAKSLIMKLANLKADLQFAKLEAAVKAKEVLSEKQLKTLETLMKEFHKKKAAHGCEMEK